MNSLLQRQNDREFIKLLRASAAAYTKAKSGEMKVTYFLILLAFAYPITYMMIDGENPKHILFGCSFLLTVLVQLLTGTFKGNTYHGAIFKEEFDCILFNLRWKTTLRKPDRSEISKFSFDYKGKEIKDWYSPNLSVDIPDNTAIAVLQHSNTQWDINLRILYRQWLMVFLIGYSVALWIFLIADNASGMTIFLINFSILSFYIHIITQIRGHTSAIEKRRAISKHLDEMITKRIYISTEELRDIQDEIFISRLESAKVPDFFSRWYQKKMNAVAEDYIETVNTLFSKVNANA